MEPTESALRVTLDTFWPRSTPSTAMLFHNAALALNPKYKVQNRKSSRFVSQPPVMLLLYLFLCLRCPVSQPSASMRYHVACESVLDVILLHVDTVFVHSSLRNVGCRRIMSSSNELSILAVLVEVLSLRVGNQSRQIIRTFDHGRLSTHYGS